VSLKCDDVLTTQFCMHAHTLQAILRCNDEQQLQQPTA
jgi:hypothetical protein